MRILITGASGLLGSNLAADYAAKHEVFGVFHQNDMHIEGVGMVGADLTDRAVIDKVMEKVHPHIVVHCAAATDVDRCQRDRAWAMSHNRDMAQSIAVAAWAAGAGLVHISTDAVYSGEQPRNREQDTPAPVNVYGESKLAGEVAVREAHPQALIVRTNLFGIGRGDAGGGLLAWFLHKFAHNNVAPGFTDILFSPILVNDLGRILLKLFERGAGGILNVGGSPCLSKFAFGQAAAAAFGYPPDSVRPTRSDEAGLVAPRPKRLCLDSGQTERLLGAAVPNVEDGLGRLANMRRAGQPQAQVVK